MGTTTDSTAAVAYDVEWPDGHHVIEPDRAHVYDDLEHGALFATEVAA